LVAFFSDKVALAPRLAKLTGRRDFSFHQLYADSELAMVDSIAHLALPQPGMANDDGKLAKLGPLFQRPTEC